MTVGLYDIDFNHKTSFSISLPLMKAYNKLYKEGHQVIMMKPYEKTSRYNKVFYFKESPTLMVPKNLIIDSDKAKYYGYGFLKKSGLSDSTKSVPPSFFPYEVNSNRIRNKPLFSRIKNNCLIDWRERDFTNYRKGTTTTFINDTDFLEQQDWIEVFNYFDNNVDFIHSVKTADYETAIQFLEKTVSGRNVRMFLQTSFHGEQLEELLQYNCVIFPCESVEQLFLQIFEAKIISSNTVNCCFFGRTPFEKDLIQWAKADRISFKDWKGASFNPSQFIDFKYRLLLKQDPKKMTYNNFKEEWLT